MALLPAPVSIPAGGLDLSTSTGYTAANAGGDTLSGCEDGRVFLHVKNGHTAAQSVQIGDPGKTPAGNPGAPSAVSVPASTNYAIPVPVGAVDPSDGLVDLTYPAGVTALTVKAVRR